MTALALSDYAEDFAGPPVPVDLPSDSGQRMVSVRIAPLIGDSSVAWEGADDGVTETVIDQQLIVDYTNALARRTAARVRAGDVDRLEHSHEHPTQGASCLRCAVLGTSRDLTLGVTLLELLSRSNAPADEEWNCSEGCTDTRIISRLRRLAVSAELLSDVYGPHWCEVMLMCLRVEAADFRLLHHLVREHKTSRVLTVHTRFSLAAYHLATIVCPWTSHGDGEVTSMLRGSVAVRLAVTAASVASGQPPAWLDHLPAPVL